MSEIVFVSNLCIHGYHGVNAEEATLGQKFFIDIECEFDARKAIELDDISASVNYKDLCSLAQSVSDSGPFKLIETLGDRIAAAILEHFLNVERILVRIRKPSAPLPYLLDSVGFQIERRR